MPYLKISLISFPPLCVFKHAHTHTHLTTRLPQITISCFSSHIQPLLTYNYTLFPPCVFSYGSWNNVSVQCIIGDAPRPSSLEALLCTCISCNNNLTGKHIHSHGFRVPEQSNKLAAITHICGSAWLNPCCTVSSSCGGHFSEFLHQY